MHRVLSVLLLVIATGALAAGHETMVMQVVYPSAAELLPSLEPLLSEGSRISAHHDRLVVNATSDEIATVRNAVRALDRPPRRLLIEVRRQGSQSLSATGQDPRGGTPPGFGPESRRQPVRGPAIREIHTRGHFDETQRVRALDRRPALVRLTQAVPVQQVELLPYGVGFSQRYQADYRETASGFWVLPEVRGDQVTVRVRQSAEHPIDIRFTGQQVDTVLQGRLGEWLPLASTGDVQSGGATPDGWNASTRRASDWAMELRVIAVD